MDGGLRFDWFLARRYLSARRGGALLSFITWISLGGVTVGVTALIVVIAVMTGMQEDLRSKILSGAYHVTVETDGDGRIPGWAEVAAAAGEVEGVRSATPFLLSQVNLRRGQYSRPADLVGVPSGVPEPGTEMEREIQAGFYDLEPPASGLPPILLGSGIADAMQLFRGDTVQLLAFDNLQTTNDGSMIPKIQSFEVTGVFRSGMYEYDTRRAYTTMEATQAVLDLGADVVTGIGVALDDGDAADRAAAALSERLGAEYRVETWGTRNSALFSALKLEKLAMFLVLFLIVLVAAFNIVSTLVMVVADRTREIGILKSMGMTDRGILRVFVLQGAWIGVVGTAVGTALGVLLCVLIDRYEIIRIPPEVYFVDRLPVSLHFTDVLTIVAASVVVAFVATIHPSIQASQLQPVEAIRDD
ncbi:FtsX-like permease family protein [Gaopeijia maritima]|uniref:ABC transporter permease n=1 Tax=Gaopeijia maritima TaxID=3119007 RepID=A0ABU9E5U1_9BACT